MGVRSLGPWPEESSEDRTSGFLEGEMSFHRNWGSRRKPEGVGGGNLATSRSQGRGGEVKGRVRKGLGCGGLRLPLLSLLRSGHRHEGPPAEMIVLAPAWSPTVRILGDKAGERQSGTKMGRAERADGQRWGTWTGVRERWTGWGMCTGAGNMHREHAEG